MTPADIFVIIVIAALVAFAAVLIFRNRRKGKCSGFCAYCSMKCSGRKQ